MIEREDGPIKYYYLVCDKCGKQTKRYSYGLTFNPKDFPGWKESGDENEPEHYCPKCTGTPVEKVKELAAEIGKGEELSNHEAASVYLKRLGATNLEINIGNGSKVYITSDTPIKVEQHDE